MPWVEILYNNSTAGEIYDIDELRELFGVPPHEDGEPDMIPFVQLIALAGGTTSRTIQFRFATDRKGFGSRGTRPAIEFQSVSADKEHLRGQISWVVNTELQMQIIPIGEVFRQALLIASDGTGAWTINFKYILVEGNFLPDTEILERLADRRRMDRFDTDDPTQGPARMGKLRRMGDANPGT